MDNTFTPPTITDAAGDEHKLRRLGLDDVFELLSMVGAMVSSGGLELGSRIRHVLERGDNAFESLMLSAFLGAGQARERLTAWVSDVVGVTVDQFCDVERFPLSVQTQALKALATHPDFSEAAEVLLGGDTLEGLVEKVKATVTAWME
jgi:hypothetical protein